MNASSDRGRAWSMSPTSSITRLSVRWHASSNRGWSAPRKDERARRTSFITTFPGGTARIQPMMDGGSPDAAASTGDAALRQTDVLVIGGGPAGSTVATLLARRGHRVPLLEKRRPPRFHIGESLLPANLPLFEQLGVAEQVRAIGMRKLGAEFISPWDGRQQDFRFAEAWDKSMPYSYQVRRSQFDEILIRNAAHAGAQVIEACRVRSVEFQPRHAGAGVGAVRIEARHQDGRTQHWQARYLVDASGRDTFLANSIGVKRRNTKHNSAAIFGHFGGAERHADERAGHISIYWFDYGWFWFI